jgi:hypothetical protein
MPCALKELAHFAVAVGDLDGGGGAAVVEGHDALVGVPHLGHAHLLELAADQQRVVVRQREVHGGVDDLSGANPGLAGIAGEDLLRQGCASHQDDFAEPGAPINLAAPNAG